MSYWVHVNREITARTRSGVGHLPERQRRGPREPECEAVGWLLPPKVQGQARAARRIGGREGPVGLRRVCPGLVRFGRAGLRFQTGNIVRAVQDGRCSQEERGQVLVGKWRTLTAACKRADADKTLLG
jgi:hypothetical protein